MTAAERLRSRPRRQLASSPGSDAPPEPPKIERRIGAPFRLIAALVATLVLPLGALSGLWGKNSEVWPGATSLRVAFVFLALLFAFRILGKRELGRLSPFELVTLMLVPEVLSSAMQGEGSMLNGLVGVSTLLAMVVITSVLAHRFEKVELAVEAPPTVLVAHGRLLERALNVERILPDELFSEMHKQGLSRLDQVAWAVLESSGNITFVPEQRSEGARDGSADDGGEAL